MAYHHGGFTYAEQQHVPVNMLFSSHSRAQFPQYSQPSYPTQSIYNQYGYPEHAEYGTMTMMGDEWEDPNEITTRPRLTKEQVDVLESQFQEHPKPNSLQKRQLAMQTKLSLPRVANWFQNRRAKAKQQRKQEEFESRNQQESQWQAGVKRNTSVDGDHQDKSENNDYNPTVQNSSNNQSQPRPSRSPVRSQALQHPTEDKAAKAAAQASLQRALASAHAGMHEQMMANNHVNLQYPTGTMGPPVMPVVQSAPSIGTLPFEHSTSGLQWSVTADNEAQNMAFDFAFNQSASHTPASSTESASQPEVARQTYVMPVGDWDTPLVTPVMQQFPQDLSHQILESPPLPTPQYAASRRGSEAEILTSNFESFNFATSPVHPMSRNTSGVSLPPSQTSDNAVDIAARRKRPRPAALTSASLRTRSYGALTSSTSPTFRPGMTPPTQALRHAKSAGHGLNSHYAGIRKFSTAQKSPLHASTFAGAEAYNQLMKYDSATLGSSNQDPPPVPVPPQQYTVPDLQQCQFLPIQNSTASVPQISRPFQNLQSPPVTPFNPEMTMLTASMMAPSTHAQYAATSGNDFTPPYSAGPLTSTSWSDAPLRSPELGPFPPITYIPSLNYPAPAEDQSHMFAQWAMHDGNQELRLGPAIEQKKTEFFIQEFPGQKEEHAQIAQKMPPQAPKAFVFSNTGLTDYGE